MGPQRRCLRNGRKWLHCWQVLGGVLLKPGTMYFTFIFVSTNFKIHAEECIIKSKHGLCHLSIFVPIFISLSVVTGLCQKLLSKLQKSVHLSKVTPLRERRKRVTVYWRAVHKYTLEDQITAQYLGQHLALRAASDTYGVSLWYHGEMLPSSMFAEWPQ